MEEPEVAQQPAAVAVAAQQKSQNCPTAGFSATELRIQ